MQIKEGDDKFYSGLAGKELTAEEVFEAKHNFVGFFDLLYRIDKRLNEQNNDKPHNGNPSDSDKA